MSKKPMPIKQIKVTFESDLTASMTDSVEFDLGKKTVTIQQRDEAPKTQKVPYNPAVGGAVQAAIEIMVQVREGAW